VEPGHVAQDHWSLSNYYKRSRHSINRRGRLSITCTIAKQQEKQQEHCCEALAKHLSSQRFQEVFLSVNQFSLIFLKKNFSLHSFSLV